MTDIFRLRLPTTQTCPIIANLPHSGLFVPADIAENLTKNHQNFLPNQDWHLDKLYQFLPDLGITVLQAVYSRYVVDLNRILQPPFFGNFWRSVVPEKTAFNASLYQTLPSSEEIEQRIEQYYKPYHQQLHNLLEKFIDQFGKVYLLDLHSFFGLIPDPVCLGNVNGKSCSEGFISTVERAFSSQGYPVVRNKVFKGGYITQHYGKISQVEALQIEVRYPVYLNWEELEQQVIPNWNSLEFSKAQQKFESIFRQIVQEIHSF